MSPFMFALQLWVWSCYHSITFCACIETFLFLFLFIIMTTAKGKNDPICAKDLFSLEFFFYYL